MAYAAKCILSTLVVALATYGLDCLGVTTPEQAMRCCNTTPQIQADFGRPSPVHGIAFAPGALGPIEAFGDSQIAEFFASVVAEHSHDPPHSCCAPVTSLRI